MKHSWNCYLRHTSNHSLKQSKNCSLEGAYEKLVAEAIKKPQLERKVAVKKLEWPCDNAEKFTKFFKVFTAS